MRQRGVPLLALLPTEPVTPTIALPDICRIEGLVATCGVARQKAESLLVPLRFSSAVVGNGANGQGLETPGPLGYPRSARIQCGTRFARCQPVRSSQPSGAASRSRACADENGSPASPFCLALECCRVP